MAGKPLVAWSHSVLDMFEQCRRKYHAVKIRKINDRNKFNMQGDDEHKAIEHSLKTGTRTSGMLENLNPVLDRIRAAPGEKYYEYEMTLDNEFIPCGWRDWNRAWVRGAADFLRVHGPIASYIDWKSGKFYAKDEQIETMALLTFRHFPDVQTFHGGLYYYRHNRMHPRTVHRGEEAALWQNRLHRVKQIEIAITNNQFPPSPGPLCAYCPDGTCPHNTNPDAVK